MKSERRPLQDWEKEECLALKAELDAFNSSRERRHRLTQEDLAAKLGTSQGNVSAHLSGKRALNIELAAKMAEILEISVDKFSPRLAAEIEAIARAQTSSPVDSAHALLERATPRSRAIVNRIIELERQGRLTDADLSLLQGLIERFSKDS